MNQTLGELYCTAGAVVGGLAVLALLVFVAGSALVAVLRARRD